MSPFSHPPFAQSRHLQRRRLMRRIVANLFRRHPGSTFSRCIMPKVVVCPTCKTRLSVPDSLAAKSVACPRCSGSFTLAAALANQAPPTRGFRDLVVEPMEKIVRFAEETITEKNIDQILDKAIRSLCPPSGLVKLAFVSDCLRVVSRAVCADGKLGLAEVRFVHPLVVGIVRLYAQARKEFQRFLDLKPEEVPALFEFHRRDTGIFG